MRSCIRCKAQMIENLAVRTDNAYGVAVGEKGLFKGTLGKLSAAVCPECGYVETYLAKLDKIEKLKSL